MSHPQNDTPAARAKSPLGTALLISFAIAAGAIVSTLDAAIFDEIMSGRWLTRPFAQAQERNTAAIASLEQNVGAIGKDIDFVAARVAETARRSEDLNRDRFAEIEARLAALKERVGTYAARAPAAAADLSGDMMGLRTSHNDLAATHAGAVTAMTRRLDRIEVMVGISTDMVSSVDPATRQAARRAARKPAVVPVSTWPAFAEQSAARPERGHLFNVKPMSEQSGPLRLSRLPG
jgi:ABC-type transporter Mla subunit MlaD